MSKRGSIRQAFPTIIASGKVNGASPHATPTDRKVEEGDFGNYVEKTIARSEVRNLLISIKKCDWR